MKVRGCPSIVDATIFEEFSVNSAAAAKGRTKF